VEFSKYLEIKTLAAMKSCISEVIVTYGDKSKKTFTPNQWFLHGRFIIKNIFKKKLCQIEFKNLKMESIKKAESGMKFGKPVKSKKHKSKSKKQSFENSKAEVNKAERKDIR